MRWSAGGKGRQGWLWPSSDEPDGYTTSLGFYIDYGPEVKRPEHAYCQPAWPCGECQPGTVLAVCNRPAGSHWFPSVEEAKAWVEARAEGHQLNLEEGA